MTNTHLNSKVELLSVSVHSNEVWVIEDFVYLGVLTQSSIQSSPDILRHSALTHTAMQSVDKSQILSSVKLKLNNMCVYC